MPGRGGGAGGRTGCDGSGRGPPIGPGRGGRPPPGRWGGRIPAPAPAPAPTPGRAPAAGRLRFPVGACCVGVCAGGRTSIGRRGGAGGAWPVRGSSTRRRIVGGTTRPVSGGVTGRGGIAAGGAAGRPERGSAVSWRLDYWSHRRLSTGASGARAVTTGSSGAAAGTVSAMPVPARPQARPPGRRPQARYRHG